MGNEGFIPALHVGGVQEAITVPWPVLEALAVPTLEKIPPVFTPEMPTEAGFDVLHVSGTFVTAWPAISVAVAFKVVEPPLLTRNEVWLPVGSPVVETRIFSIRQVSTEIGWLLNPLAVV